MAKVKFAFNPIVAYRNHGKRYAIYVSAQLAFMVSCLAIALLSLWAGYQDIYRDSFSYGAALTLLKVGFVCFVYLIFEHIYWKVRFAGIQRRNAKGLTDSSAQA